VTSYEGTFFFIINLAELKKLEKRKGHSRQRKNLEEMEIISDLVSL